MNNFKSNVPMAVQIKLKELAELAHADFSSLRSNHGQSIGGESRLSEIEGNYVSGWIPRQDGGFTISELMQSDIDSSYHFTEKQTESMAESSNNCWEAFLCDNGLDDDTELKNLSEEQKDELCGYELEWFSDGALLSFDMFVEGCAEKTFSFDKEPEKLVTLRVSINYKDGPYFRQSYAEDIKTLALSVDEFLAMDNGEIIKQMTI